MSERTDPAAPASGEVLVDARGLRCPLPVLRLAQAIAAHSPGPGPILIRLLATDPAAATDVAAFCRMRELTLLESRPVADDVGGHAAYLVVVPAQERDGAGQGGAGSDNASDNRAR